MFDFERLKVFNKAVDLSTTLGQLVEARDFDQSVCSQIVRASNQIVVEIAHGAARINVWEKKKRFANARSNVHECAAVLILLHRDKQLPQEEYDNLYHELTSLSIMLYKLVQNTTPKDNAAPVANNLDAETVAT